MSKATIKSIPVSDCPAPVRFGRGKVAAPDPEGRCGRCGYAHFTYSNGHEISEDGTRGYRCANCGSIKREDWRKHAPHGNTTP